MEPKISLTQTAFAEVMTEWERRWREEPELSRMRIELLKAEGAPETYGGEATAYFFWLAKEMGKV